MPQSNDDHRRKAIRQRKQQAVERSQSVIHIIQERAEQDISYTSRSREIRWGKKQEQ